MILLLYLLSCLHGCRRFVWTLSWVWYVILCYTVNPASPAADTYTKIKYSIGAILVLSSVDRWCYNYQGIVTNNFAFLDRIVSNCNDDQLNMHDWNILTLFINRKYSPFRASHESFTNITLLRKSIKYVFVHLRVMEVWPANYGE